MNPLIHILDDDEKLTRLLSKYLTDFGFQVHCSHTPSQGLKAINKHPPDCIILDVMLPEIDGFEVCRQIRKTSPVPIIMLTARGELTDKVVGLEIGSDDYLAKPFEPRELVARINSLLRRINNPAPSSHSFGELSLNYDSRSAFIQGEDIQLSTNEFAILALLCSHPGKVFDRDSILQHLRGIDCDAFNRTVDIGVSRLRQKLGDDPKNPRFIKTVWGAGYIFISGNNETD